MKTIRIKPSKISTDLNGVVSLEKNKVVFSINFNFGTNSINPMSGYYLIHSFISAN